MGCVRCLATGQIEGDDVAGTVRFGVDFGREPTARTAERLAFLPPFAPAAETCARTMVESNIWIRWADALIDASVSKKASNTPALLSRSKRFQTVFQCPKRSGSARQRTFSTVKKCIASRNSRSFAPLRPRRGKQARNTVSVWPQSPSFIRVDIDPDLHPSRNPMNHNRSPKGIPKISLAQIRPHGLATPITKFTNLYPHCNRDVSYAGLFP